MTAPQTPEASATTTGASGPNQYRRGADLEREIRDDLQREGYFVIKSGGSKTPVDLAAFKPGQTLFLQVKRNGRLDTRDWNELHDLARELHVTPVMATKPKRGQLAYWVMTGQRTPRSKHHPCRELVIDEVST